MKKKLLLLLILFSGTFCFAQKQFSVISPDGKLKMEINISKIIEISVIHDGDVMISKSPISMTLTGGKQLGVESKLIKSAQQTVNSIIESKIYKKSKVVNNYNELMLSFKGDYKIVFRAYNDGAAYRFITFMKEPIQVKSEQVEFNFPEDEMAFIPYVTSRSGNNQSFQPQFYSSFENTYEHVKLSQWDKQRLAFLPLVVEGRNKKKICIVESDLLHYPGMYLNNGDGGNKLKGIFAPYPKDVVKGGHNMLQGVVQSTEPYIAKCNGTNQFPWRGFVISSNDYELANNDLVYKLAEPCKIQDVSWIKPGKVAWDWWNDWNVYGVNFKSGVNNDTYKYYIDFAAEKGIEYVILDEGWAVNKKADLFQVIPEIDLKMLVDYAKNKNVDLILWAGYNAFDADIEKVCKVYSEMGIKGFKVDFMDRDDQQIVDFLYRSAEIAAKYKLLLDFHGIYKPTGLNRTYPNVINFEGVHGLEQMKWSENTVDQVTYDVTIPFIRQVAGPMDYTQGAMRNSTKQDYRPVNSEPMSQGTRCHQLAEYIIFESPLCMLCDNPSNYYAESECTQFIATVPTVWDETIALNGEISKYITIARRSGNTWYIGSLTNWDSRSFDIDLSFLGSGSYKADLYRDGVNANRVARDYKKEMIDIPQSKRINVKMAPGGGFVMKITKK